MVFGETVRVIRLERGWSQEDLAELADVDRTYVSGLERGVRNPALSTQARVVDALGLDMSTSWQRAEKNRRRSSR